MQQTTGTDQRRGLSIILFVVLLVLVEASLVFLAWRTLQGNSPTSTAATQVILSCLMPTVALLTVVIQQIIVRGQDRAERAEQERQQKKHELEREQKRVAVDLFRTWMTDEFYVRARMVAIEYLVPPGNKWQDYRGKGFDKIMEMLVDTRKPDGPNGEEGEMKISYELMRDQEARTCIRAITNFFWMVDQVRARGLIAKDEQIFRDTYAWYWVHIIRLHISHEMVSSSDQFRAFVWMTTPTDIKEKDIEKEHRYDGADDGGSKMKFRLLQPWEADKSTGASNSNSPV